jgi:hypothetical protein
MSRTSLRRFTSAMGELISLIERARQAQQEHEQKHDVQLEIPGAKTEAGDFMERRKQQIELETGRDPRD